MLAMDQIIIELPEESEIIIELPEESDSVTTHNRVT